MFFLLNKFYFLYMFKSKINVVSISLCVCLPFTLAVTAEHIDLNITLNKLCQPWI